MNKEMEIIQEFGEYLIVKYYANALNADGEEGNGLPYYGDIYLTKEEVLKSHPKAKILKGFGFVEKGTGVQPENTPDWFNSVGEVIEFIKIAQVSKMYCEITNSFEK